LLNKWNKQIENVFVDISVKKDEQEIEQFRTKSVDLEALARERLNDYWDTQGKQEGVYSFDLVVNFLDNYRMKEKKFSGELISAEEFEEITKNIPADSLTGKAVSSDQSSGFSSFFTYLILCLVVLALIILIGVYFYRKGQNGKEAERIESADPAVATTTTSKDSKDQW